MYNNTLLKLKRVGFVGVGYPKSGTTWLYEILNQHPEICMCSSKETNFFLSKEFLVDLRNIRNNSVYLKIQKFWENLVFVLS